MRKVILFVLLGLCLTAVPLHAHGGGKPQLVNVPVGVCQATVWLNPSPPKANKVMHVTVGLKDATLAPMLDSTINLMILDGETVVVETAVTTEKSVNQLFYETDLDALPVGDYQALLTLESADCSGELTFPMTVEPASYLQQYLIGAAVLVAIVLIGFSSKRQQSQPNRPALRRPPRRKISRS